MNQPTDADIARFWSNVAKAGPDDDWLWTGGKHARGHGRIHWLGKKEQAHRVAWNITHGPDDQLQPGDTVLQTCGNPLCVNPAHLERYTTGKKRVTSGTPRQKQGAINTPAARRAELEQIETDLLKLTKRVRQLIESEEEE